MVTRVHRPQFLRLGPRKLPALLRAPGAARGLVVFAHGSGSGHRSPRNSQVAEVLTEAGYATLLIDLLTAPEEQDGRNVFDIELLGKRLTETIELMQGRTELAQAPIGLFGASTGAAAAILAASDRSDVVDAVVSRGGRPDLAGGSALHNLRTPTLLIVGGLDYQVVELNRSAARLMRCPHRIQVIDGAGHLFEEPGTLAQVIDHARQWFDEYLISGPATASLLPLPDRATAGRLLGRRLEHLRESRPIVLALPRGGVPVGFEIARLLDGDLDLLMVRKLGAPGNEEFAIGAIVDGKEPQTVLNDAATRALRLSPEYIQRETARQMDELERRRRAYPGRKERPRLDGRTVIIADDGVATGSTMTAALRGVREYQPSRLVLAVPVAPAEVVEKLRPLCDEIEVLAMPSPFHAVGQYYLDFDQVEDAEVVRLLGE